MKSLFSLPKGISSVLSAFLIADVYFLGQWFFPFSDLFEVNVMAASICCICKWSEFLNDQYGPPCWYKYEHLDLDHKVLWWLIAVKNSFSENLIPKWYCGAWFYPISSVSVYRTVGKHTYLCLNWGTHKMFSRASVQPLQALSGVKCCRMLSFSI